MSRNLLSTVPADQRVPASPSPLKNVDQSPPAFVDRGLGKKKTPIDSIGVREGCSMTYRSGLVHFLAGGNHLVMQLGVEVGPATVVVDAGFTATVPSHGWNS